MPAAIDSLTSRTLKNVRERWWDDEFTEFLSETLRPRPGNRILDVGCGAGLAEVSIGRLQISQIRLVGLDLDVLKVTRAAQEVASHNLRASFAAGDACRLPFIDDAFDSIFCVAVLQHITDVHAAVAELARVTRRGGRLLAVEPDNAAHYMSSSVPAGRRTFDAAAEFFNAVAAARGDSTDPAIGPKLPSLFVQHGIEALDVRLFPVANTWVGAPENRIWVDRRASIERTIAQIGSHAVRTRGQIYLDVLAEYEAEARAAGPSFVEIQHTMLFATLGQRED